jgi:Flp pilus assembly protein TadD
MYAGTLTPSLEEKAAIYEAATKKGQNWNAHNNLGAVYIAQAIENSSNASALADKALAQLQLASKIQNSPEVNANMASAQLLKGNPYAAYDYANKAAGLSGDNAAGLNGVKGASEIYLAKYSDAVRSESSASDNADNLFNKGLAQILTKDYQNALTSFKEATSKNSNFGLAHYGAAIASAKLDKADDVVSNLSNAVKADPTLKENALSDLEFAKYAATEAFRNALK